jgi:hypothetical protein
MNDDVRDSLIPYDEIVQDALRAVVGRVLSQIVVMTAFRANIISISPSRRRPLASTFPRI